MPASGLERVAVRERALDVEAAVWADVPEHSRRPSGALALYAAAGLRGLRAARSPKAHDEAIPHVAGFAMVTNPLPPKLGDLEGRRVGGYTIGRLLGEGGMGSVYLASNSRLGRKVAIKVIAREYTQNPEIVGRFFREAKAVAALDDPNIIEIYDCHEFAEDGLTYISMKFIDGHSLAALLRLTGPFQIEAAVAIAVQIASGLDAAHEQGIVHRDIKPENILISSRWRRRFFVTILDFGIAKLLDPLLASNYRTKTSLVMGTLDFMAPEQARGERDIDARADIYALGVVLYELLTGRRPYVEETVYGLVEKHTRRAPFPRPRELRSDIPQVVDELLLDMLQVDRRKRPGSMQEVGQRVTRGVTNGDLMLRTLAARLCVDRPRAPNKPSEPTLVGDVETSITRSTPAPSTVQRQRAAVVPFAVAIAGGAVLGAGAMWLATSRQPVAAPVTAEPALARTSGSASVADARLPDVLPADAAAVAATSAPDAAVPVATVEHTAAVARDAGTLVAPITPDTGAAVASPTRPAAVAIPPTKPEPKPDPQASKPPRPAEDAVAGKTGVLVIRTHTWADVSIDGVRSGTAPVRLNVTVGRHSVLLVNDLHRETVPVNVVTNAETVIEKSW